MLIINKTNKCKGAHANALICFLCPFNGKPSWFPLTGSHILLKWNKNKAKKQIIRKSLDSNIQLKLTYLISPSILPEAIFLPLGLHAMHRIHPLWPRNVCRGNCVLISHTRTVVSPEPVHKSRPSGENCTERTASLWPIYYKRKLRKKERKKSKKKMVSLFVVTCETCWTSGNSFYSEQCLWLIGNGQNFFCGAL